MITEEGLPTYMTMLNTLDGVRDETGASSSPWAKWTRMWTAEENRHGENTCVTALYIRLLCLRSMGRGWNILACKPQQNTTGGATTLHGALYPPTIESSQGLYWRCLSARHLVHVVRISIIRLGNTPGPDPCIRFPCRTRCARVHVCLPATLFLLSHSSKLVARDLSNKPLYLTASFLH